MGSDKRTRQPVIEWKDDDERENLPLVGFYGFYELQNGFFKAVYWSHEKILNHADRYSKAFSKAKYEQLLAGKLSAAEADKLRGGSPWYDEPLSEAHMKMCKKTVLIQMLGDGTAPLSLEMQSAIKEETIKEEGGEFIVADDPRVVAANAPEEKEEAPAEEFAQDMNAPIVDAETGEIVGTVGNGEQMSFVAE
jgi:recombination protein RecT